MTNHASLPPSPARRRAFSIVEAVIATAITGGLLVAAMSAVGASARARRINADNELGVRLANDLLEEVLSRPYADEDDAKNLGLESTDKPTRADFDDIDDFDGLLDSPASSPQGVPVTSQPGWRREVVVRFATRADVEADASADKGVKRVVVTASRYGKTVCTLTALRTQAWDSLLETQ